MEGNYSAGLFTTASDTAENLRAARTRSFRTSAPGSPPSRPHCLITYNTGIWMGDEPPPGPPAQPREAYHVDDYSDGPGSYTLLWLSCSAISAASPVRTS